MQSRIVLFVQLFKSGFDLEDWFLSLVFLHSEISNFLFECIEFGLFVDADAFGLIVLFLDLTELCRYFSDLLLVMLHG